MTDARSRVLERVRGALGRSGPVDQTTREALEARLRQPPAHSRIAFDQEPVERFIDKAQSVAATVTRVASMVDVGAEVAGFLKRHNLAAELVAAPALAELQWPAQLEVTFGATDGSHATSVTPCRAAVAETGSLVMLSGVATPTTLNLLPDNHVVVVRRSQVVRDFETLWQQLREIDGPLPRTLNLITGPSRTADIEQTMQLGAHGPRRVHIVLVED